jgi:hypothetical protein
MLIEVHACRNLRIHIRRVDAVNGFLARGSCKAQRNGDEEECSQKDFEGAHRDILPLTRLSSFVRLAPGSEREPYASNLPADSQWGWMPPGSLQIEGKTLRQLLQPPAQSLDCQTIIDWIGRTASALSAARYTGIVHRDIKPVHGELLICPEFREF